MRPALEPALVFDLDGVLVDTAELVTAGWLRYAEAHGHALSAIDVRDRMLGRRGVDVLREEFGLPEDEAGALIEAGLDDKTDEIAAGPGLSEVPGARAFVTSAIADGLRVALVSSASATNIALALSAIGLEGAFPVIVDASRVSRGKPAPDPYLAAAAALDVPPSSMIVFEDSDAGVAAALAAGATCVGIASTLPRERLAAADLVIDDLSRWTPASIRAALAS